MTRKIVLVLVLALVLSSSGFCQTDTIKIGKFSSVIMKLPYEKPEGIEEIFNDPRFSVIIEHVYLNGEETDIGMPWFSAGGDEALDAKRASVSYESTIETACLSWEIMNQNETGNRYLFLNSIANKQPVYYCIPEYTTEVCITYKIQFPFTDYETVTYTQNFKLEWELPDKDYITEIDVIVFGFNSRFYNITDKINLATIQIELNDYTVVKKTLEDIYNSFSNEKKSLLSQSYQMMMEYVDCLSYTEKNKYMKFKTSDESPCFALFIQ